MCSFPEDSQGAQVPWQMMPPAGSLRLPARWWCEMATEHQRGVVGGAVCVRGSGIHCTFPVQTIKCIVGRWGTRDGHWWRERLTMRGIENILLNAAFIFPDFFWEKHWKNHNAVYLKRVTWKRCSVLPFSAWAPMTWAASASVGTCRWRFRSPTIYLCVHPKV